MTDGNITAEMRQLFQKSGDEALCEQVYLLSKQLCQQENIIMTDYQQLSLISHLSAMVHRSITKEKVTAVDKAIFTDVSENSIKLAKKITDFLPNLIADEVYLLSIHFEVARQNKG